MAFTWLRSVCGILLACECSFLLEASSAESCPKSRCQGEVAPQRFESDPGSLLQLAVRSVNQLDQDSGSAQALVSPLQPSCSPLVFRQTHYTVEIEVGTPPQKFDLVADTGSNHVIVASCLCQKLSSCSQTDKCFTGTNRSSSFFIERSTTGNHTPRLKTLSFGSGMIQTAISTDVVKVGGNSAHMKAGLLLMVGRALRMSGPFEGILGLGLPNSSFGQTHNSNETVALAQDKGTNPPGFLQTAGIPRFSVCFTSAGNNSDGVLRFSQPPAQPNALIGSIGRLHWALDFRGFSIGGDTSADETGSLSFCAPSTKSHPKQETACAAVPDSGTTVMMGPKSHILALFGDLCDRWSRCQDVHSRSNHSKAYLFQKLLSGCANFTNETHGLDQELPPLHFHFVGANGTTKMITLRGATYVEEAMEKAVRYVKKLLFGVIPIRIPVKTGHKKKVCRAAFASGSMSTTINGPVWILGLPIFYEYQVGYDLTAKPPAVSFTKDPCGTCSKSSLAESDATITPMRSTVRKPRLALGPRRLPSIDVTHGL